MKNQNQGADSAKLSLMREKHESDRTYRLYHADIKEGGIDVVYICERDEYAAEVIPSSHNEAERLFERICEGGLSCEHLADVANDYKHALIC